MKADVCILPYRLHTSWKKNNWVHCNVIEISDQKRTLKYEGQPLTELLDLFSGQCSFERGQERKGVCLTQQRHLHALGLL